MDQPIAIDQIIFDLLVALGEDPTRPGLEGTPSRVARMWSDFINYDPGVTDTVFESIRADQMVIISGIKVWSMCEHHLLPFWTEISIGYIPREYVLGLSKFARVAHQMAHKLQLQERLVQQIADEVQHLTGSPDVAVIGHGEHLCMVMRGIRTPGIMTTSVMNGAFRDEPSARAEFLKLVDLSNRRA